MPAHLSEAEVAKLRARILKAEETATEIAVALKTTLPTVLRHVRALGVQLPRGRRGPAVDHKGPRLVVAERALEQLQEDVRELLRCMDLPADTSGKRRMLQKALERLHASVH